MPAPKKRLGKGKNRLKFEDVSPRAEREEQEMLDKKMYGGKMKKPVSMKDGGKASRRQRSADAKISKKMDADNLPHSEAMQEKKKKTKGLADMLMGVQQKSYGGKVKKMMGGGMCRGMGKATRGGNYGKMG